MYFAFWLAGVWRRMCSSPMLPLGEWTVIDENKHKGHDGDNLIRVCLLLHNKKPVKAEV